MNPPGSGNGDMKSTRQFFRGFAATGSVCAAIVLLASVPADAQTPAPEATAESTPSVAATAAAAPSPPASPTEHGRVLYPASGPQPSPGSSRPTEPPSLPGLTTSFLMLLGLCAGGYFLLRRQTGFAPVGKGQRKLVVSESRSLGNRQFLVVVEYESERVLLGVTPGRIDYLCPLSPVNASADAAFKERLP